MPPEDTAEEPASGPAVLFLGTSLTAGYGIDPADAYPALLQHKIEERGWPFRVVNAGVSGHTSTDGLEQLEWLLRQDVAVLVLELGANDGLRGISPELMERNLRAIVERTRERHPGAAVVLAGMQVPPNMGRDYSERFRGVFERLAQDNALPLVPFLLEGVGGEPELNLEDGVHPNMKGHQRVAENVWAVLEPVLAGLAEP